MTFWGGKGGRGRERAVSDHAGCVSLHPSPLLSLLHQLAGKHRLQPGRRGEQRRRVCAGVHAVRVLPPPTWPCSVMR